MAIHLAAVLLMLAGSQQPATSQPASPQPARETASYVIGPQDQLAITVYDEPSDLPLSKQWTRRLVRARVLPSPTTVAIEPS